MHFFRGTTPAGTGAHTVGACPLFADTIATYEKSLELTRNRPAVGVVGKFDVVQAAKVQTDAVRAARESVALTINQYKARTVSYLSVVTVQTGLLSNEHTPAGLSDRRLSATVGLVRALGGGWNASDLVA